MRELNLDALLKEKREEPTVVSMAAVDSWLKGGIAFVGLFATIKWLFTKKMWFMFTSISSISMVTILAIVQFNSSSTHSEKGSSNVHQEPKAESHPVAHEKPTVIQTSNASKSDKGIHAETFQLTLLSPKHIVSGLEEKSMEPIENKLIVFSNANESKDQFTRIDANGFVHFTLVNGSSCSIKNTIPTAVDEVPLDFSIKNGTLYLNSANENNAADLIITVTNLEKIKLNGFCEMVTSATFESADLEIEVNGFTKLAIDLNVQELEIDMNGETKGTMHLKGDNLDLESTGFNELEIESDFKESRLEVSGFSKIKFVGTSAITMMEVSGETKISAEEFHSQELFLKVSGDNDKLITAVSDKLDVEISGKNNVEILGSPEILHQEVLQGSKLKLK
jgi:hypothetical protein